MTRVNIVITTDCDFGSASWINKTTLYYKRFIVSAFL